MEMMTCTVFGNPIIDQTLKGLPMGKGKTPTRVERATQALSMKNTLNTGSMISQYLASANAAQKTSNVVFTCCMVYNATGDPVTFVKKHDYQGYARSYPSEIKNGQAGMFMHKSTTPKCDIESSGAVVYRGQNKDGESYDWMFAWRYVKSSGTKQAYTEVNVAGHFDDDNVWIEIYEQLCDSEQTSQDEAENCESYASIGGETAAIYDGLMTIKA